MSVISGTVSAIGGAMSQEDANKKNAENTQNTNALNYQMFRESRGANGNAILPLYMKGFETTLGNDAIRAYNDSLSPTDAAAQAKIIQSNFSPMQDQANQTAEAIFSGGLTAQELAAEAAVAAARQQGVDTKRQSGLEALSQTLNEINAIQAGKGYSSDSLGNRMLKADSMRKTFTQSAADQAAANLETAKERAAIKEGDITRKLGSLDLPGKMLQQNITVAQSPNNAYLTEEANRQGILNFFKLNPQVFQNQNLPQVGAVPSTLQIGSGMMSAAGSQVGSALINKYLGIPVAGKGSGNSADYAGEIS